jgi:hypothetical protein
MYKIQKIQKSTPLTLQRFFFIENLLYSLLCREMLLDHLNGTDFDLGWSRNYESS